MADMHLRGDPEMTSPVSNVNQSQPVYQSTATSSQKPAQPKSQPAAGSSTPDTVQLSSTAQAALAAAQEAKETPAQTAREASGGDRQAQRLLARENAARVSMK
jgi:hypothetical protein